MSRVHANLVEWKDDKGYGFARLPGGTDRIFVHAKSFHTDSSRPKKGDLVELEVIKGRNGRPAGQDVRLLGPLAMDGVLPYHLVTASLLLIVLFLLVAIDRAPFSLVAYYAVAGALSIYMYRYDKQAAIDGKWRIKESWLLGADLAGGIIGGLLAQHRYRHKKSKSSFQVHTFIIVAIHAGLMALVGTGLIDLSFLN